MHTERTPSPARPWREVEVAAIEAAVAANMLAPIAMVQRVIDGMCARRWGRIVCITSGSVKAPIPGLDLSSGARIGLQGFLAGVARQVAQSGVTISAARVVRHAARRSLEPAPCERSGHHAGRCKRRADRNYSGRPAWRSGRIRRGVRVPVLRTGRFHHGPVDAAGRRRLSRSAFAGQGR